MIYILQKKLQTIVLGANDTDFEIQELWTSQSMAFTYNGRKVQIY